MLIGIDGNEANVENKVGVSVYAFELLKYFYAQASENSSFVIYLRRPPHSDMPRENAHFKYRVVIGPVMWSQLFLPIKLYTDREIDVFFAPAHYIPRFCPVPIVVTLHDLAYVHYPHEFLKKDLYKLKNWTADAVKRACKIIAVSENTAMDAIKYYKIPKDEMKVVLNGFRLSLNNKNTSELPPTVEKPFILFVGTLQPRKNVIGLLEAFTILRKTHTDFQLVIAGKKGWLYNDIFSRVRELKLEPHVLFTGYVDDETLAALYKNASLYICPGFYEGFGYPMLEAMYFNCPVVASSTGALPEVGGDASLYFDPHNPQEMSGTMQQVLNDATIQKELIKHGTSQIKKFSWEKCGQETLDVIKSCYTL